MQGKIIKGVAGFYYVFVNTETGRGCLYECKAKGIFRKEQIKPLVGDNVVFDILDEAEKKGNIIEILPRYSEMLRPAVANVDQALIIFSVARPQPNFNLLDRFLFMMEKQKLICSICFNKQDIEQTHEVEEMAGVYASCGYRVLTTSAAQGEGLAALTGLLSGKTTALAGPSGVGKSSIINCLNPAAGMETGSISEKIERGKHTTRHSEIIALGDDSYIVDTPGFTSFELFGIEKERLKDYYPEFRQYEDGCRFNGCLHLNEPGCGVKDALEQGRIHKTRYRNYQLLYKELTEKKKY